MLIEPRKLCKIPIVGSYFRLILDWANDTSARLNSLENRIERIPSSQHVFEAMARIESGEFVHDTVVVLGSGPSIAELTDEERDIISGLPTIAMNRYLPFWEMIGLWPSYVFAADSRGVAPRVFLEICKTIHSCDLPAPKMLLENYYRLCVPAGLDAICFSRDDQLGTNLNWADDPLQPMFFHRGSLSTLMNVISVFRIARNIALIGIDLNRAGTFFDCKKSACPTFFNEWEHDGATNGRHATTVEINGWKGSILDHWNLVNDGLTRNGIQLVSLSDKSELVVRGLCQYMSPLDLL